MTASLDELDRLLINHLHSGFPLQSAPFSVIAEQLALDAETVLRRLQHLLDSKALTRFGPLFQIERAGGAFTLAALSVAEDDFDRVAAIVNGFTQVAHNYRREHALNMWFVVATERADEQAAVLANIEQATGLPVCNFPKLHEFFVELRLPA